MMYGIRLACCSWLLLASYILIVVRKCMAANDTLTQSQELLPGQTLISPGQIFELGFFTPRNSSQMYVGIWYKIAEESMVVWVANRENSLSESDTSSRLMIDSEGNLKLIDGKQQTVWSTNVTFTWKTSTVAVLSDKGELNLKDNSSALVLWESFNIPGDTFLANMMLGFNSKTGEKRFLRSWRTENDPAPGNYVFGLSEEAPAQIYVWTDFRPYWRGGPWNGLQFLGLPMLDQKYSNGITMIQDNQQGSVYLTYSIYNNSYVVTSSVSASGLFKIWLLDKENSRWYVVWETPEHFCDLYGACGSFGVCNKDTTPNCQCLKGFVPKSEQEWKKGNWTSGCVRQIHLPCERNNTINVSSNMSEDDDIGFWKLTSMKLPDQYEYLYNVDSLECHQWCLINCSCAAYAYPAGIGCLVWLKDLLDIQQFSFAGEDLYLRLPVSALGVKRTGIRIIIIPLLIVLAIVLMCAFIYYFHRHKVKSRGAASKTQSEELQLIEFGRIRKATNNFSEANKLGSGGFGTVYEGALEDGQKIAVKRLSCHSGQGIEEFKNEVALISKLQHRNLVRILGCCIEGEEKLLVFECLKNRSLDTFLFDATKRLQLDWSKRFNLIEGIARGLLYLHRDSRLKIIHRDLKASNVLLDDNMSPKISDFGLARAFQVSQEVGNTPRIAGTYGYMSPEYAMGGLFSEKSDIYSFGVLLLEIVSGKKNTGFSHQEKYFNLLGYAWQLWNEGNGFDLVDEALANSNSNSDSCFVTEVMRCIQIGLLCVQDHAAVRPTMSNVVQMLSSENDLPQPTQPTFTLHRMLDYDYQSPGGKNPLSVNEVTVSDVEGR